MGLVAFPAAVHRTVLVVDVSAFGDRRRTNLHQLAVRRGLYDVLERAFDGAGVPWTERDHEDRGDGVLVILPPTVAKSALVEALPTRLVTALREYNTGRPSEEAIRLRLALHAGEIHYDDHGVVGRAVNHAFRLLDAPVFTAAHARSGGLLSMITSAWFFDEVVWHSVKAARDTYSRVQVTAKETEAIAWIRHVDGEPVPADEPPPLARSTAPHQLPPSTRQFVGRDAELVRLTELLTRREPATGTVIVTIDGTAGIGKTALALEWAHRVRDRFPDGELHINLRGFDEQDPLDSSQVLDSFLQTLGVHPQAIPAGQDAKSALYRSMLSERRLLVVLDNARSSDHVRPLLPASPTCVAVVTSRNRLDSLLVREGAHRIALDVLSDEAALALIAERIDHARLEEDPRSTAELVRRCAHLPLALSVAAARAANQPALSLRGLLKELHDERRRLDALDLGEPDLNLRAVFSWSYSVLSPVAARLFRLLGIHPGADIGLAACRSLSDDAPIALRELTSAHLVAEYRPSRFRLHDLLRAYAAELAATDPERPAAVARLVDHYLITALDAERHLLPHRYGRDMIVGEGPLGEAGLVDADDAMIWFTDEHPTLLALVGFAAGNGLTGHAWRLGWACTTFLRRTGRWSERAAVQRAALAAAIQGGDRLGEATSRRNLATAIARVGEIDEAVQLLDQAMELHEELGDEVGMFKNHLACMRVLGARGGQVEALRHAEKAWSLVRDRPDRLAHADALAAMADQLSALHRDDEALPLCTRAFELYTAIGHLEGQANVLLVLGDIERALGRPAQAVEHYRNSHALDRRLGDRYWGAISAERLAEVYPDDGDRVDALREALATYREIRHPAAERVEARLAALMTSADVTRAPEGGTPTC
ncbi:ATP-binding protein [Amycolatopsis sp. NPDC052450]|uniref:ATP-binding protein n=1 Tax=Amycolatopsis sp. NPDC052450 TaxID=3363937 RepID=UPI0037C869B3